MDLFSVSSCFLTHSPAIHVHSILFKEHHKICIAYSVYIFSFKSMKGGHDRKMKVIRKVVAVLLIGVLLVTVLTLGVIGQAGATEPKTWHVDDDLADYPDANCNVH